MNIKLPIAVITNNCFINFPVVKFAEQELLDYFGKIFGHEGEFPMSIVFSNRPKNELRHDGSEITVRENEIIIAANLPTGILHGVYELLKLIGCSFIFPKNEKVVRLNELCLENKTVVHNPFVEFRGFCLYGTTSKTLSQTLAVVDYMAKNYYNLLMTSINRLDDAVDGAHAILWNEIADELRPELEKRGIAVDMSEHSTDYFFDREKWFKLHPEWFSLIDGKRLPGQICYSNQDAVVEYAKSYVDFVKSNNDFLIIGVWPLDGGGYCQCESCKDPLAVYHANEYIAKEIHNVRPDLIVEHLAYTSQSFSRPETPLPKNMSALVCNVNNNVAYEWGLKAKACGGAFYFDYHTGDNYRFRSNLWINPFYISNMINTFVSYDYRGIVSLYLPITSKWQASLNYYYLSKLYYDPTADIKELTAELCGSLFGEKNKEVFCDILMLVYEKLQNQSLWSSEPFKQSHYSAHITGRNKLIDGIHKDELLRVYAKIEELFRHADVPALTHEEKRQADILKDYVRLQRLYFTCIDQFDAQTDTPDKAESYFLALGELHGKYGDLFSAESYARWRIVGRDNVFDPKNANEYQPPNGG